MTLDIIVCRIGDIRSRNPKRNELEGYDVFFEKEDCGGELPSPEYHPVLNALLICAGQDNFRLLEGRDSDESGKYGIAFYGPKVSARVFLLDTCHESVVQVAYVRTPEAE